MKRLRIILSALLALLVLGALAASSASAAEGLLPLNQSFTVLSKKATLEALSGSTLETIICGETKGNGKAETNSDTHGSITFDFLKCEVGGLLAFSLGELEPKELKEALILALALYLICLIEPKKLVFGVFVEVSPVHIHVKALGILINVKGSVIGELTPSEKETTLVNANFAGKDGVPTVKECFDESGNAKKAKLESERDPAAAVEANEKSEGGLLQSTNNVILMDK